MEKVRKLIHRRRALQPTRDLNLNNIGAGLVSALLAVLGPPAIILEASPDCINRKHPKDGLIGGEVFSHADRHDFKIYGEFCGFY